MADALTTFCNFTNPEVGASSDTWGTKENADRVALDAMISTLITGLTLSAAGGTATFGIAVGAVIGAALTSAYTKTASAWALGTAAGSLDTGAIASATWYHVYLIQRSDTGVVDILTSLSASAPTMPTNYDRKRRIGSMLTDGSAQWVKFVQVRDKFIWAVPVNNYNTTLGTGATLITMTVPTGIQVEALARGYVVHSVINKLALLTSPDETSAAPNAVIGNVSATTQVASQSVHFGQIQLRTNTSGQIRAISDTTLDGCSIATYGWVDNRGAA